MTTATVGRAPTALDLLFGRDADALVEDLEMGRPAAAAVEDADARSAVIAAAAVRVRVPQRTATGAGGASKIILAPVTR